MTKSLAGWSYKVSGEPTCSTRPLLMTDEFVGNLQRLVLVMRDEDRGHVYLVMQPAQPVPQFFSHLGVERAERFVEQQH